jgi:hypothetical protein
MKEGLYNEKRSEWVFKLSTWFVFMKKNEKEGSPLFSPLVSLYLAVKGNIMKKRVYGYVKFLHCSISSRKIKKRDPLFSPPFPLFFPPFLAVGGV